MRKMSKILMAALIGAAAILPAANAEARVYVGVNLGGPPAARVEIRPVRPWANGVWIDGHWARRGGAWVWIPGHWDRPYGHYSAWVPGHYNRYGEWVEGHWR